VPRENANGARAKSGGRTVPGGPELIRLYADYLHEEDGGIDSDHVFLSIWAEPKGHAWSYQTAYDLVLRLRARTGIACKVPGCNYSHCGRGLCQKHLQQWDRTGRPGISDWLPSLDYAPPSPPDACQVPSCGRWAIPAVPFCHHQVNDALRFVQLTPPGSACSIVLGTGITQMPPGSQKGVQCVVADVAAARQELIAHGVQASGVDVQPWGSFVTFSDPDGNTWALQQLPPRP
jgi:hypothetical protein